MEITGLQQGVKTNTQQGQTITNQSLLKQNAPQDSFTLTNAEKPSTMKSFGKGILFNLKQLVPFVGTHDVGKIENQHKEIMNKLNMGHEYDMEEKGKVPTFGKGILTKLAYSLPFYGIYKLGKTSIENDYAYKAVMTNEEVGEFKKPGVLKCLGKGIVKSLALAVPFYGTYLIGKDIEKQNQVYNELKAVDEKKIK